jgi:hypothetical protein
MVDRRLKRRRFWCLLAVFLLSTTPSLGATKDKTRPKGSGSLQKSSKSSTRLTVRISTSKSGIGGGDSVEVTQAKARVNPCPLSQTQDPRFLYRTDKGEEGIWEMRAWKCNPAAGWEYVFVCVQNCPPNTPPPPPPPIPPSRDVVLDIINRGTPLPDPQFAPPIENGSFNGKPIAAVVGKRFYVNVTTESFTTKTGSYAWDVNGNPVAAGTGYWYADVYYNPVALFFDLDDGTDTDAVKQTAGPCPGPGISGRTEYGRKQNDSNGCYVLVNNRPENSTASITVLTTWVAYTVTNLPGNYAEIPQEAEITVDIPVKELQAVIVK